MAETASKSSNVKRAERDLRRRMRNRPIVSRMSSAIKKFRKLCAGPVSKEQIMSGFVAIQSIISSGVSSKIIHRNTASRRISRLAALASSCTKTA